MKRDEIQFEAKDAPLREDVSTLAALLGEILEEQGGKSLYTRVEESRRFAIGRRSGLQDAETNLVKTVSGLSPGQATSLTRAFSLYFQITNLAERVHRIRRRRDYQMAKSSAQRGSFSAVLKTLKGQGVGPDDLAALFDQMLIEPVFTAHPTESTRRTILRKHQRIAQRLVERFNPNLTPHEERVNQARIRSDITIIWQTQEHPSTRLTVADELEHVLFFLTDVIYRVIPVFYEHLQDAVSEIFGAEGRELELPNLLRFSSWVGGDMDGNPNVTAATILSSLNRQRQLILNNYFLELSELANELTHSTELVTVSPEVAALIDHYGGFFPETLDAIHDRHRDMAYQKFLKLVAARVEATYHDRDHGYEAPGEFLRDLTLIQRSLSEYGGRNAGLFAVERLRCRARTFGFNLVTLDVRQDARVLRTLVGRCLGQSNWENMPARQRSELILEALNNPSPKFAEDAQLSATLDVFRAIDNGQRVYGDNAVATYVISMTQGPDDVLSVIYLSSLAGLAKPNFDIAPLFETVDDLNAGPGIMEYLLKTPLYRRHVAARNERQMIMVGYSDSNKDGGLAASRWALYKGQAALAECLAEHQVKLVVFHGRGGSVSRGGGRTDNAIMSAPTGTVNGHLRVTEQGETINHKYGLRGIAIRNLEEAWGSVARATLSSETRRNDLLDRPDWAAIMDTVAEVGRQSYRQLVYEEPNFPSFFQQFTPIDVIERMRIGSRPASRRGGGSIDNLRAIPWVFSWTQTRLILPGWFGFGSALSQAVELHGQSAVTGMIEDCLFFATLLDDVEMVLAKADLNIAQRYQILVEPRFDSLFDVIETEYALTKHLILELKGVDNLLHHAPAIARAIQLRNPYVDPMNLMQVDLLERWRIGDRKDPMLLDALLASVNGIAQAMQNTG